MPRWRRVEYADRTMIVRRSRKLREKRRGLVFFAKNLTFQPARTIILTRKRKRGTGSTGCIERRSVVMHGFRAARPGPEIGRVVVGQVRRLRFRAGISGRDFRRRAGLALYPSAGGAKPLRIVFSVIVLGKVNCDRYSRPPALLPTPDILKPPKGCLPTKAPVIPRFKYKLPT